MKKNYNNQNGFTLIELIIVLAIITILGAIAAPNFLKTSAKARLKTDVQSARIIQNSKELYETETGEDLNNNSASIINILVEKNYLKKNYAPQTRLAEFKLADNIIKLDITQCDESIKNLAESLTPEEQDYIINNS